MSHKYPLAMHGPDAGLAVVRDEAEETALRAAGWIDGHEYWSKVRAGVIAHVASVARKVEDVIDAVKSEVAGEVESAAKKIRPKKGTADGALRSES